MEPLPKSAGDASKPFLAKGNKDSMVGAFFMFPNPGTSMLEKELLVSAPSAPMRYMPASETGCQRRAAMASMVAVCLPPKFSRWPGARGPRMPRKVCSVGSAGYTPDSGRANWLGTPEKPVVSPAGAAAFLAAAFFGAGGAAAAGAAAPPSMPHCFLFTSSASILALGSGLPVEGGGPWAMRSEVRPPVLTTAGEKAWATATPARMSTEVRMVRENANCE
mmetsp:Transcript_18003/g.27875  ORF Transcript_18003/g.27875 Transcript_18003/m.27875 type:complete len:220 (-) Transcript_18003:15-674(-)